MTRRWKTVDVSAYELAAAWMDDRCGKRSEGERLVLTADLAVAIQQTIEDFLADEGIEP